MSHPRVTLVEMTNVPTCVACLSRKPCWRVLRVSASEAEFPDGAVPEGAIGDHVDGHLPLCGDCLLECPTCERPVVPDATRDRIELLAVGARGPELSTVVLRWFVEPCDDPTHARRAIRTSPPSAPEPPPEGPPRHVPVPGQCWVAEEWGGVRVGDEVVIPRHGGRGRVFEIWSHRLGGGVVCTIVLADSSWVMRLASEVVKANLAADAQPLPPDVDE